MKIIKNKNWTKKTEKRQKTQKSRKNFLSWELLQYIIILEAAAFREKGVHPNLWDKKEGTAN